MSAAGWKSLLPAASIWLPALVVVLVLNGVGTAYRLSGTERWGGALVAVVGLLALGMLGRAVVRRLRLAAVAVVLGTGLLVHLASTGVGSTVLAEEAGVGNDLVARLEHPQLIVIDNPDALEVRVERSGVITEDLGRVCLWGTSGAPARARLRWTSSETFTIRTPAGYGSGPWAFRVDGATVRPADPSWQSC